MNFNPFFVNSINYSDIVRRKILKVKKKKINDNQENNKSCDKTDKNQSNIKKHKIYDYLEERRKMIKERNKSNDNTNDIKRYIKNNGISDITLNMVNNKLRNLDEKQRQKSLLLKYKGEDKGNPELREELFDIMIDSII